MCKKKCDSEFLNKFAIIMQDRRFQSIRYDDQGSYSNQLFAALLLYLFKKKLIKIKAYLTRDLAKK